MRNEIRERIEAVRRGEVPEGYVVENHQLRPVEWGYDRIGEHLVAYDEYSNDTERYQLATSSRQGLMLQTDYYGDQRYDETTGGFHVVPEGYITYRHMSDDDVFKFNMNTMGTPVLVSPEYPVFTTDGNLDKTILVEYLNGMKEFRAFCSAQKKGSTRTRMYFNRLGEFSMPIPPVAEQRRIAEVLEVCDQVIQLKRELIEEKRKQKRWLMGVMLFPHTGFRLPEFDGNWQIRCLSELGDFSKGVGISNNDCASGEYPCIKYGDIYVSFGEYFDDAVSHTQNEIYEKAPKVSNGTLLFTGSGEDPMEIGKCTAYLGNSPIAVGGDIIIMKPYQHMVSPLFLAFALNSLPAIKQKAYLGQGYSIVHIYKEDIKQLEVAIPPTIEEQERIADILRISNLEIKALEYEIVFWQQKKKALMQLLLTGIVRVNA